jgi:hypothetical protein
VVQVFCANMTAWLQDEPLPNIYLLVDNPSTTLREAVNNLTKLGWGEIFRGRLVLQWATLYNHDVLQIPLIPIHQDNEVWGQRLIKISWNYFFKMWDIRNDIEVRETQ